MIIYKDSSFNFLDWDTMQEENSNTDFCYGSRVLKYDAYLIPVSSTGLIVNKCTNKILRQFSQAKRYFRAHVGSEGGLEKGKILSYSCYMSRHILANIVFVAAPICVGEKDVGQYEWIAAALKAFRSKLEVNYQRDLKPIIALASFGEGLDQAVLKSLVEEAFDGFNRNLIVVEAPET